LKKYIKLNGGLNCVQPIIDPSVHAGTPDIRSPMRYIWWVIVMQPRRVLEGSVFGSGGMIALMLPPYLLSRAVDDGIIPGDSAALLRWAGALLAAGVLNAWLAVMRHRIMTKMWMDAAFRSVRIVAEHSVRLGSVLPRHMSTGEMFTIGYGDAAQLANVLTITGPGVGAILAYAFVAVLVMSISPILAMVVLLGVPVLALLIGPLLGNLQSVESAYREEQGRLASCLVDLMEGLRVLVGFGGKDVFADRYRHRSQALQKEGYRVGAVTSWIQALSAGLPIIFLATMTWLAARMASQNLITAGEMVAVYGYAAVLIVPVSNIIQGAYDLSRGLVAADRLVRFLRIEPLSDSRSAGLDGPIIPSILHDPVSGVKVHPGLFTVLVGTDSHDSVEIIERLGRFTDSSATWGDVLLSDIALAHVRKRILVADNDAALFTDTIRNIVGGRVGQKADVIDRVIDAAMARDIVQSQAQGIDSIIEANGRNLSGGQRQRIRLARALMADPEVLLAVEPTSAVDAHTEAAIMASLRAFRGGRTTLVSSRSPLVLDQADIVCYIVNGHVAATGTHDELLARHPGYQWLLSRDMDGPDRVMEGRIKRPSDSNNHEATA
jgi:ABC-type bacteriocin/lantibiotic exporter with double-glycine peptidase domain